MATLRQLKRRRMSYGIGRPALAREMGCSESWVRLLEVGYQGRGFHQWQRRYSEALTTVLEKKKAACQ
jgi:predicted transcriptional regulator